MAQYAFVCSNVCKQCSLHVNSNKGTPVMDYEGEIGTLAYKRIPVIDMTIKLKF